MKNRIDWSDAEEVSPLSEERQKPQIDWSQAQEAFPDDQRRTGGALDFLGGTLLGGFQGLSDLGASIAHSPSELYNIFTGKQLYETPKPNFRKSYPESMLGHTAAETMETMAPFALPGLGFGGDIARGLSSIYKGARSLPLTSKMAARPLEEAKRLVTERGLGGFNVPEELLKDAMKYLPHGGKTLAYKELLKGVRSGDYQKVYDLQSDLGQIARRHLKSASSAERGLSKPAGVVQEAILKSLQEGLENQGAQDIASIMAKGRKGYGQFKHLEENVYPKLRKHAVRAATVAGLPTSSYALYKLLSGEH